MKTAFIPAWLREAGLNPNEFTLYCYVQSIGSCWQSFATIAEAMDVSEHTVRRALKSLVARGFMRRQPRQGFTDILTAITPNADAEGVANTTPPVFVTGSKNNRGEVANTGGGVVAKTVPKGTLLEGTPLKDNSFIDPSVQKALAAATESARDGAGKNTDAAADAFSKQDFRKKENGGVVIDPRLGWLQELVLLVWEGKAPVPTIRRPANELMVIQKWQNMGLSDAQIRQVMEAVLRRNFANNGAVPAYFGYFNAAMADFKNSGYLPVVSPASKPADAPYVAAPVVFVEDWKNKLWAAIITRTATDAGARERIGRAEIALKRAVIGDNNRLYADSTLAEALQYFLPQAQSVLGVVAIESQRLPSWLNVRGTVGDTATTLQAVA